jgi:hypothetical protein
MVGDVSEHPFPGDGHCIHCPSFLVWDWRYKCLQFVIQTGGKPARPFLQLIGFLISLMDVIPLGRLHIRPIQGYLREFWHPVTQMWEACIPVLPRLLAHLQWWLQRSNLLIGIPLKPPESTLTLYTDASLTGWGAFLEGRTVSSL